MSNYCLDDKNSALLITETDESEYILETHGDEKANVIRSAYLFSMVVDQLVKRLPLKTEKEMLITNTSVLS